MTAAVLQRAADGPILTGLRLFEIVGDCYEPELRGGSFVMVAPTGRFLYDGEYLLDFGYGEAPYRATRHGDRVHIGHPNPRYGRHHISAEEFRAACCAVVVAEVKVKDAELVRAAQRQQVSKSARVTA